MSGGATQENKGKPPCLPPWGHSYTKLSVLEKQVLTQSSADMVPRFSPGGKAAHEDNELCSSGWGIWLYLEHSMEKSVPKGDFKMWTSCWGQLRKSNQNVNGRREKDSQEEPYWDHSQFWKSGRLPHALGLYPFSSNWSRYFPKLGTQGSSIQGRTLTAKRALNINSDQIYIEQQALLPWGCSLEGRCKNKITEITNKLGHSVYPRLLCLRRDQNGILVATCPWFNTGQQNKLKCDSILQTM